MLLLHKRGGSSGLRGGPLHDLPCGSVRWRCMGYDFGVFLDSRRSVAEKVCEAE